MFYDADINLLTIIQSLGYPGGWPIVEWNYVRYRSPSILSHQSYILLSWKALSPAFPPHKLFIFFFKHLYIGFMTHQLIACLFRLFTSFRCLICLFIPNTLISSAQYREKISMQSRSFYLLCGTLNLHLVDHSIIKHWKNSIVISYQ